MPLLALLLTLVSSLLSAMPVEPKLVTSLHAVCLLAGDPPQLNCWTLDGRKLPIPELDHPFDIASGNDSLCALDKSGVQCWIDQADFHHHWYHIDERLQKMLGDLRKPRTIVGGEWDGYCVWDDDAGYRCVNAYNSHPPPVIPLKEPAKELVGGGGVVCAIVPSNEVKCWGPFESLKTSYDHDAPELLQPPPNLHLPHDLGLYGTIACVVDGQERLCWGQGLDGIKHEKMSGIFPQQVTANTWLDAHVVRGFSQSDDRFSRFQGALLAAGRGQALTCVASASQILCRNSALGSPFPHRIALSYSPSELWAPLLDDAARNSYLAHRKPFDTALKEAARLKLAGRFFLFDLVSPLISGTDSDYFQKTLAPLYNEALRYWQPRLAQEKRRDEDRLSALRLAVSCLPDDPAWAALKVALGNALSRRADEESLRGLADEVARAPLAVLDADAHYAPAAATLKKIFEAVRPAN